ncbi:hypothetical protein BC827DRAFT_203250 [Russula dissimulans]|nr:hypothetical protein BC827DRAFT_203250 [Russula dissimulans]
MMNSSDAVSGAKLLTLPSSFFPSLAPSHIRMFSNNSLPPVFWAIPANSEQSPHPATSALTSLPCYRHLHAGLDPPLSCNLCFRLQLILLEDPRPCCPLSLELPGLHIQYSSTIHLHVSLRSVRQRRARLRPACDRDATNRQRSITDRRIEGKANSKDLAHHHTRRHFTTIHLVGVPT